jgi:hypothetical protein
MVTWLNIQFIVCLCAGFQSSPRNSHWKPFSGSSGISNTHSNLGFGTPLLLHLIVLSFYADFTRCGIDQKTTSGTCHFLGSSLVCWSSHKQTIVAQFTIEAEYVAAAPKFFG